MSLSPAFDLRQLKIVVACPRERDGEALIRHLQRLGGQVTQLWPAVGRLEGEIDVLFSPVDKDGRALTAQLIESATTTVIGVADPAHPQTSRLLSEMAPHGVLLRPIDAAAVTASLIVAHNAARYRRRLLGKIGKLEERLRTVREVNRAKTILMEKRRLDEPGAYAVLREQAMRRRVPIGVIASLVVEANEVLPDEPE